MYVHALLDWEAAIANEEYGKLPRVCCHARTSEGFLGSLLGLMELDLNGASRA